MMQSKGTTGKGNLTQSMCLDRDEIAVTTAVPERLQRAGRHVPI